MAIVLAACSPHDVTENPTPPIELPESYGGEAVGAEPKKDDPLPERWWRSFGAQELDRLVEASLSGSFDMYAAWARLWQAEAMADQAGAPRWPTLDASLSGSLTRRRFVFPPPGNTDTFAGSTGALQASYELDIWNKLGSTARAAALERDAAADGVQAMAVSLTAEVTETWLDLVRTRARRQVLERQIEVNESFLEVLQLRFGQGQATAVDVNQQLQLVLGARAEIALTRSGQVVLSDRLAVLVGRPPSRVDPGKRVELPELPPLPGTGVPSELLQRRPDLRAAQRRVEAADHRVAAAIADRYPSLRLTAAVTSEPGEINDWALDPIWNLAAGLTAPIFDGGRRAAEVERQRGVMAELVSDYGKTVLTAFVEVQDALVQEREQRERIARLTEQLAAAELALSQARDRYSHGVADFLTVLTSLGSQQQVELTLLDARRQLLSHRVQLCRALGGAWTVELERPEGFGESS